MRSIEPAAMLASAGILLSVVAWSQQQTPPVDQLLDKYVEAVGGAEKYAAISTWYEKREITGDLTDYVPSGRAPTPFKSHGVIEYFFKAPNLRITSVRSDRNDFVAESGCDGKEFWAFSPRSGMQHKRPQPGHEYTCQVGMSPFPIALRRDKAKLELKGQKEVKGRMAFVIRADVPDQPGWNIYYLDSEKYLLLRVDSRRGSMHATTLYSDYRDVGGFKVPFHIERHADNTDYVTNLQDVQVNVPIDERAFRRPDW